MDFSKDSNTIQQELDIVRSTYYYALIQSKFHGPDAWAAKKGLTKVDVLQEPLKLIVQGS